MSMPTHTNNLCLFNVVRETSFEDLQDYCESEFPWLGPPSFYNVSYSPNQLTCRYMLKWNDVSKHLPACLVLHGKVIFSKFNILCF